MLKYQILCVLTMFIVTYLLRSLPILLSRKKITNRFIKSVLYYIPYAVLASLTFPAIFYSTGSIATAAIGTDVALIMSFFRINLAIVAVVCVAVVFGFGFIL